MKLPTLKCVVIAAALGAFGVSHAAGIDFEEPVSSPFAPYAPLFTHGNEFYQGGFWLDTFSTKVGALDTDLVGALVDGSDVANICGGIGCPTNNLTNFFTSLNDGYLALGLQSGGLFRASKFDASFIAAAGDQVLSTAMLLRVDGYLGTTRVGRRDILLPGPVNGAYSFSSYSLGSLFAGTDITELDIYGFACTTLTTCTRSLDKAQFALDNINVVAVPEPSTWALMIAGLAAAAGAVRRRSV